jgi:Domain of unknown function (DUF4184)
MPFTFSHPAIVLPFRQMRTRAISMSALVVASMIPDFQYFFSMKLNGRFSHTLPGIVFFDVPAAFVIWIVFHTLVKKPLIDHLPAPVSGRLQDLKAFDFLTYLRTHPFALLGCILAGATSHILWDAFTHHDGAFVPFIPALDSVVHISGLPEIPVYRYLQHISTLIGAGFIAFVFWKMPMQSLPTRSAGKFWIVLFAFAIPAFLIRSWFGIEYYGDLIVIIISAFFIGLLAASALEQIRLNKR